MKAYIIGGSGYTGGELLRILLNHPKVSDITVTSRKQAGQPVSSIHPHLPDDIKFSDYDKNEAVSSDIVFTCVPHTTAMDTIPEIAGKTKIVDLSADYRLKDAATYERYYKAKHKDPQRLTTAVYGMPELHREEIKKADLVANPGCFPTAIIPPAKVLKDEFKAKYINADAKTGVSGAGAEPKADTHFPTINDNIIPYKTVGHQHTPEIQQEAGAHILFTPHLVPLTRGILATIYALIDADAETVTNAMKKAYGKEPFVVVRNTVPSLLAVRGSNYIHMGGAASAEGRVVIFSAIDNLTKGASSQAVQNMNLMLGYKETDGIRQLGLSP
ncbi:[LysW]-L-2-aminoadipate/[LysW]-L-glutamate phosphate reductase [uncultured archaeon]|nr:[LysW]-L-2-aminoadipate/[LysW]-L-glutamate phosphate reductase [uncultured archaeon]